MLWKSKWKKDALRTIKGANKFISYKKDLIDPADIENIRACQKNVKDSLKSNDAKEVKKKCNLLEQECKKSLSTYVRPNSIAENTEVFFVAIVVALGVQTYLLKPFRIPTGSMQPTLNGINGHVLEKEKWPSFPQRLLQIGTHGRTYVNIVAPSDCSIANIQDTQVAKFFTRAIITFSDGSTQSFSASANSLSDIIATYQQRNPEYTGLYTAGETITQGFVDSGDLVLVDKFSYHFKKPTRGETFVFDTRGIDEVHKTIEYVYEKDKDGNLAIGPDGKPITKDIRLTDQVGGAHYIKRCVGVPGDTISITSEGKLMINGEVATDKGLAYAQDLDYKRAEGFTGYTLVEDRLYSNPLSTPSDSMQLNGAEHQLKAEYAAFGDHTNVSLDSRYWGTVKQYNLVGPALISLWPFTHEVDPHWGLIK